MDLIGKKLTVVRNGSLKGIAMVGDVFTILSLDTKSYSMPVVTVNFEIRDGKPITGPNARYNIYLHHVEQDMKSGAIKEVEVAEKGILAPKRWIDPALSRFVMGEATEAFVTQPIMLKLKEGGMRRLPRGAVISVWREENTIRLTDGITVWPDVGNYVSRNDRSLNSSAFQRLTTIEPASLLPIRKEKGDGLVAVVYATGHREVYDPETGKQVS